METLEQLDNIAALLEVLGVDPMVVSKVVNPAKVMYQLEQEVHPDATYSNNECVAASLVKRIVEL